MFVCPMHPEISQPKPGRCPLCGMGLVKQSSITNSTDHLNETKDSYAPLIIIIGLISLVTVAVAIKDLSLGSFELSKVMSTFMAGFFLVFAGVKLLDIKGFAQGYFTYDLLARRWFGYGYIYPLLELALGLSYLLHLVPVWTNIFAIILLVFSGLGVTQKLLKHEKFQCACLGTLLKVPLTKVTLIEDFGMAAMALVMLLLSR